MKTFEINKWVTTTQIYKGDPEYIVQCAETGENIPMLSFEELKSLSDFLNDYVKKEGVKYEQEKEC